MNSLDIIARNKL